MYTITNRIRYSEVGPNRKLDLFGIIKMMQDCSILHSDDVGLGFSYLDKVHRVWLMSSWQLVVNRYPMLHETITVSTWPYDFKSMLGYRNFVINDSAGEVVAYANSIWVYFDSEAKRPAKILPENVNGYVIEPPYPMEYSPRKIELPKETEPLTPFPVTKADLDNNNHVNNCQYIRMAEEYLPAGFSVKQMRADYRKSAIPGDMVVPHIAVKDNVCTIVLTNNKNEIFTVIEFLGN